MKKQGLKRLVLSRETLRALSSTEVEAVIGAGPTALSVCKDADCGSRDPDACAGTWLSTCGTR